ncbi:MAG: hypothetical protein Q7S32_01100, partial [bacterium]|nr:hypothetical protein [bacterium]
MKAKFQQINFSKKTDLPQDKISINFMSRKSAKNVKYISLLEASKTSPYSQEYLSLLARKQKIFSKKIGRNWYTTREALHEYIRVQNDKNMRLAQFVGSENSSGIAQVSDYQTLSLERQLEKFHKAESASRLTSTSSPAAPEAFAFLERSISNRTRELEEKLDLISDSLKKIPAVNGEQSASLASFDHDLKLIPAFKNQPLDAGLPVLASAPITPVYSEKSEVPPMPPQSSQASARPNFFGYFSRNRGPLAPIVSMIVIMFVLFGGVSLGPIDAFVRRTWNMLKNADMLGGHFPGTHADEVLVLDKNGNIAIYGHIETKGQLKAGAPDGLAPLVVDSITKVDNLNADYLDDLDKTDFTLSFVTKNGNMTTEDVYLEGAVRVGKTLIVKGATRLLSSLNVDGGLGVLGQATFGSDVKLTSGNLRLLTGTIEINNRQKVKNLNAELFDGFAVGDFNLDRVTTAGNRTSNAIIVGGLNVTGYSDFDKQAYFHEGLWGADGAFTNLGVANVVSIGSSGDPQDTTLEIYSKKFRLGLDGNLVLSGQANVDVLAVSNLVESDLTPSGSYSLGASSRRWKNIFGTTGTLTSAIVGSLTVSSSFSFNGIASGSLFYAQNGTAASPSFSFGSDQDTGLFRPTSNSLGFSTLGTEALRIDPQGRIGIGTTSPASTAILDLTSTTKGFLGPRLTTTQRDNISSPATGLFIYNSTTNAYNVYNGTSWGAVGSGGSGSVSSNSLDFDEFVDSMTLDANLTINRGSGNYFIGIGATPSTVFEVQGTASASYLYTVGTLQVGGIGSSTSYNRFGTNTTTSSFLSSSSDALISGRLEVDGRTHLDGNASISGNLWITGYASSSTTFGSNLVDCDTAASSKLLWDASTGKFSCGADSDTTRPASNSLDFDELVDGMTIDANLTIASAGFNINFNDTQLSFAGGIITTGGNVGIGTTSPGAKLQVTAVAGAVGAKFYTNENTSISDGHVFIHSDEALAPFTALNVRQDGTGDILNLLDGTTEVFTVINGGYVGIGTDTPTTKLEVQGTASASYFLTLNTIQIGGTTASVAYNRFGTATTTSSFLSASNDALISGKLEVDGRTHLDGNASVSGNVWITGYASSSTTFGSNLVDC